MLLAACRQDVIHSQSAAKELESAWMYFTTTDYTQAVDHFKAAMNQSAKADSAYIEALYGWATTLELQRPNQDPAGAEQRYREVMRFAPKSDLASWCALSIARLKTQNTPDLEPDRAAGIAAYQEVIDGYPGCLAAEEALMRQQTLLVTAIDRESSKKVVATMQAFIETHPNSLFVGTAWQIIAGAALTLDQAALARDAYIHCYELSVAKVKGASVDEASTLYSIALLSEFQVGDTATARKYYEQIIRDFPRDWRVFSSRDALKRLDRIESGIIPSVQDITPERSLPK